MSRSLARSAEGGEEARVDVGDDDPPRAAYPLGEPGGDRAAAAANLEALPALLDRERREVAARDRVEEGFQAGEPLGGLRRSVIEDVPAHQGLTGRR
jgi:hypothetical protein